MSRLDYKRKKQMEIERQQRGETGFVWFFKRHIGLIVLGLLVLLVSAAAIAVGLNPDFGASLFHRGASSLYLDENTLFEMPYTAGETTVIKVQNNSVIVCTKEKIMSLSGAGKTEWELPVRLSNPLVSVADGYILAADRGGKDIYLIHEGKVLLQTASAHNIINASVAADGRFVVVSDEPYYKGLVTVKDAKDNEVFVWHSGTAYIVDAVLGGDTDNLALATVNTAPSSGGAGGLSGGVLLFHLYDTEPYQTHTFDANVVTNVFRAGKGFLAVTDRQCVGFGADGAQSWTYSFEGQTISKISTSGDLTVFALESSGGRKSISAVDNNGKVKCTIPNVPSLSFISVDADRIAYNNGNNITVCDSAGSELYSIQTAKSFTELLLFDGGKKAVGLTGTSLDILEIK